MAELQAAGTEQNRKIYPRHGARSPMFGVSYADIGRVAKRIGVDHELAGALWETGNHDARVLATRVADPEALTARQLDRWARDLQDYVVTDALAGLCVRSVVGRARAEVWRSRKAEFVAATGWAVAGSQAAIVGGVDDGTARAWLDEIAATIHDRPNRVRHSMNGCLIALGLRTPELREAALEAAAHIGTVEVDHGETSCKTPDAVAYIDRAVSAGRADRAVDARS